MCAKIQNLGTDFNPHQSINQSLSVVAATGNGDPTGIILSECVVVCGIRLLTTDFPGRNGLETALGGYDGEEDEVTVDTPCS